MTRSFQAPERIGAHELALAEYANKQGASVPADLNNLPEMQDVMAAQLKQHPLDHDNDGRKGGVKGKKPRGKR